ncbi:MAG: hypothetical protein K0U69_02650 [Actinomycetia bacterium]|nr:hypothetical protein [Actinomycetes bacterium]MCH9708396.1 hypothetical protein [Actinomycetes bacterium]
MMRPPKRSENVLDEIFGDALPEMPFDERDKPSPEDDADHDRWLNENVPPHHD